MANPWKLRAGAVLEWVSSRFLGSQSRSLNLPCSSIRLLVSFLKPRFYRTKKNPFDDSSSISKFSPAVLRRAQAAFTDYLHSTRSLQFAAAESISANSPRFLSKLLEKIDINEDIERSLSRFLRYHPINEFEPFFESMGLRPVEYAPFLPRNLMFLSDSDRLLKNYLVLCHYGIEPCKLGQIYKDKREIFEHDDGALQAKIQAYENLGISQQMIVKAILCSPCLLTGDVNSEFAEVLERFRALGFEQSWVEEQLYEGGGYRWNRILELLHLLDRMDITTKELGGLIWKNRDILFEESGAKTSSVIGLLVKFGSKRDEIQTVLLKFPQISVGKFLSNLREGFIFLTAVEMEAEEVDRIIRSEALLLGSSTLKKANSLLASLNVGKKRLRAMIKENPKEMGNWAMGVRVPAVLGLTMDEISVVEKRKFLASLGIKEGSKDMEKALKSFRGRGQELQERFDCIMNTGLKENDVREMIRVAPQILNQTKDVIEMKIDFLVKESNYPLSTLVRFPAYLSFKLGRMRVRLSMFKWLIDKGVAKPELALSTIIACSDGAFEKLYVQRHPEGLEVWRDMRQRFA